MTVEEAEQLNIGDLVYINGKGTKTYAGMVLEVSNLIYKERRYGNNRECVLIDPYPTIELKQPGYDLGWRTEVQYSKIQKYKA